MHISILSSVKVVIITQDVPSNKEMSRSTATDLLGLGSGSGYGGGYGGGGYGCGCQNDNFDLGLLAAAGAAFFALYTAITMMMRRKKRDTAVDLTFLDRLGDIAYDTVFEGRSGHYLFS